MNACIFDIDGTLLRIPNSGRMAYERAVFSTFGQRVELKPADFAGTTDFKLLKELILDHALVDSRKLEFCAQLKAELSNSIAKIDAVVFPGVSELLQRLSEIKGVTLGIATGNIAATAKMKLDHAKIPSVFTFGGYGDDSEFRKEIIRFAIERAELKIGRSLENIVYVGDTPFDIEAAKESGVRVIAVATGRFSVTELLAHGPDACVEDLSNIDHVLELMEFSP